jgi:hypothetical protein
VIGFMEIDKPIKISIDDKTRKLINYGIQAPKFIAAFSPYTEFTPISTMPCAQERDDFYPVYISAAEQVGFIEYEGDPDERKFRWTPKGELTKDEKLLLYKKFITITKNSSRKKLP